MKTGLLFVLAMMLLVSCSDRTKVDAPTDSPGDNPGTVSAGLLPLAVGNWWDYRYLDGTDAIPDFRRLVRAKRPVQSSEYYLLVDSIFATGELDTVGYVRNNHDGGIFWLNFPPDSLGEDTLCKYPHVHSSNIYYFHQDCVLVAYDYPGGPLVIGDSLTHVMWYQRFLHGTNGSIIYKLGHDSIGLMEQDGNNAAGQDFQLTNWHLVH